MEVIKNPRLSSQGFSGGIGKDYCLTERNAPCIRFPEIMLTGDLIESGVLLIKWRFPESVLASKMNLPTCAGNRFPPNPFGLLLGVELMPSPNISVLLSPK